MRGRLIHKMVAVIARLDTAVTADTPSAGQGYDPDYRTPALVANGTPEGAVNRVEHTPDEIPCQVAVERQEDSQMFPGGHDPTNRFTVTLHFRDLEALGLVDAEGRAKIQPGDRLVAIKDRLGGTIQSYAYPPGLFVTEARNSGFGMAAFGVARRNLLVLSFGDRAQGAT